MAAQVELTSASSKIGIPYIGDSNFLWLTLRTDFSLFGGAESLTEGRDQKAAPRRTAITTPTEKDDGVSRPAPPMDASDFLWLMTEEPHRTRRMAILKAHPEVRN